MSTTASGGMPPPSCSTCGAQDLLADVIQSTDAGRSDVSMRTGNGTSQALVLCPSCLADFLVSCRQNGGVVEARLGNGRVIRWAGQDGAPLDGGRK